ncbi:MAG: c-type cytochrome [Candidatus Sulfobium sp.]
MKKAVMAALSVSLVFCFLQAAGANGNSGEELFEQHCSPCHPDGSNIINPDFTLHKKDRDKHGVKTAEDIVGKMRNPGPGMTQFTKQMVSDKDAKKIADYILKTFK